MPVKVLRWMKPVRTVMNRWVPKSSTIMGRPQMKSSSQLMKLMIASTVSPLFSLLYWFCSSHFFSCSAMAELPFSSFCACCWRYRRTSPLPADFSERRFLKSLSFSR